jgi:hypothetical protein
LQFFQLDVHQAYDIIIISQGLEDGIVEKNTELMQGDRGVKREQDMQDESSGQSVQAQFSSIGPLTATGLPRSLAPCFQEYDLEALDPAHHSHLILERVLAYGDRQELRWLFAQYGRPRITAWVQQWGARRLPWRRYTLWCAMLGLGQPTRPKGRERWGY